MHRKLNEGWLKHWDFELLDLIVLEVALWFAYWFRANFTVANYDSPLFYEEMYMRYAVMLVVIDIVILFFTNNYKGIIQRRWFPEVLSAIQHTTMILILLVVYVYVLKESIMFSRTVFFMTWGISCVASAIGRLGLKRVVRRRITAEKNQSKMLLVTSSSNIGNTVKELKNKDYREYRISAVSVLNEGRAGERINADIPLMFGKESLLEYVRTEVVDEVYIESMADKETLDELTNLFLSMGITVHIGLEYLPTGLPNRSIEQIGSADVVTTSINTASSLELAIKRMIDILGGIVGILFTGIFYVIFAPIIKHQSPGPAFFKQPRVGKNGRIFYIYKFRSMYMDAEERKKELMKYNQMDGLMFKMDNDPRIIGSEKGPGKGIGNFIRKTSIDEFPQFWNVLKGDMSLVGTRPPTKDEFDQYELKHKVRLSMRPGLTGMWQASGRSEITDFDEVVKLDAEYIKNWSLGLDIKLIFKTVGVVIFRKGSK